MTDPKLSEKEKQKLKKTAQGIAALGAMMLIYDWIKKKWRQSHISDKYIITTIFVMAAIGAQIDNGTKVDKTNFYAPLLVVITVFVVYFYLKKKFKHGDIEHRINVWLSTKSDLQKLGIYIGFGFGYGIFWLVILSLFW